MLCSFQVCSRDAAFTPGSRWWLDQPATTGQKVIVNKGEAAVCTGVHLNAMARLAPSSLDQACYVVFQRKGRRGIKFTIFLASFSPLNLKFFNTAAIPPELFYQILISPSITLEAYFIPLFPSPFILNSLNFCLNHYIPHLVEYVPMIDTKTIKWH